MKQDGESVGSGGEAAPTLTLDKRRLGAAASKLVAASIGDIALVLARSPGARHNFLADIEWLVLPAVFSGQFYVVEAANQETGFCAPIAVVTWALVSEEVDRRLEADLSGRIRLKPEEWKSGEIAWIVDLVGASAGVRRALQWLKAGPFRERLAKLVVRDASGVARVEAIGPPPVVATSGDRAPL
jgi:cytolysin-activating lysine-acyltransferase